MVASLRASSSRARRATCRHTHLAQKPTHTVTMSMSTPRTIATSHPTSSLKRPEGCLWYEVRRAVQAPPGAA
eukprot:scaffold51004_cov61-Phaeocystis_antarctica.AAC.12